MTNTRCRLFSQAYVVIRATGGSAAHFALSEHHVFERRQALEADRATCVQLVVADSDLGAETVLEAVCKSGRGVDHDGGRVDFAHEAHRREMVRGHDRVGVPAAVLLDMINSLD